MLSVQILFLTKALRTFAFGAVAVIIALYLSALGLSPILIGFILTATLVTDALCTALVTSVSHKIGVIRILVMGCLLLVISGLILGFATNTHLVICAAIIAVGSPSGFEGGPFAAIEQTLLAESIESSHLTKVYSWYNIAGFLPAALGSLAASLWQSHVRHLGLTEMAGYRELLLFYAGIGCLLMVLYLIFGWLNKSKTHTELPKRPGLLGLHESRKVVLEFGGLQAIDAFAGGLIVQGMVSYLFHMRYNVGAEDLGLLFFGTNVCATVSFLLAPLIARRIGLVNTMVFTHLPCSLTLCLMPIMPTYTAAATLLLVRSLFSSMDIPTRQAFTMLLVQPHERAAAAGFTTSVRALAQAIAPAMAGTTLKSMGLAVPFVIAGILKSAYDLGVYVRFKDSSLARNPMLNRAGVQDKLPQE